MDRKKKKAQAMKELHELTVKGEIERIKILLKENKELINSKDNSNSTVLHKAAYKGSVNFSIFLF